MKLKNKHIFFIPVIITVIGVIILYPFLSQSFSSILYAVKMSISTRSLILPARINFKYFVLFCGLILMSFTDMLFERIAFIIPIFLIIAGLIFAFIAKIPLLTPLEALLIGAGLFIVIDITKLGYYAFGDILTAGAIGVFVGIENIIIIPICAIIFGKAIIYFCARFDGLFDKTGVKVFHFAFVPVLRLHLDGIRLRAERYKGRCL